SLRGKTVLVGAVAQGLDPVVTAIGPMPGVELNANILNGLRNQKLIYPFSDAVVLLVNLVVVVFWGFCLFSMSVRWNMVAAIVALLSLNGISLLAFLGGYWLPFGLTTLVVTICFPVMNLWRLSRELKILKKEVGRLKEQDIFSARHKPVEDILQSIHFLQSVHPLTAWCVRDADFQVVEKMAKLSVGAVPENYNEGWQFGNNCCLGQLAVAGQEFYVALQWESQKNIAFPLRQNFLKRIFPVTQWQVQNDLSKREIVNESIEALADANRRAETSNRLMLNILDQLGHGVVLLECSGELLKINRQARDIFGDIDSGISLYESLVALSLKAQENWHQLLAGLILDERPFSVEANTDSGAELHCEGLVFHAGRPFLLLTFTDISQLKSEERKRLEAISFLSHDLRSPMSSVLALITDRKNRDADNKKLLASIEQTMERSIRYADNFIHLSKVESNAHLKFSPCVVNSVVDGAVAQLFSLAKSRGVRFQLDYQDGDAMVNGDLVMLERAFLNLIDNAIKYGGANGVVEIETCCVGSMVQIDVTDSGDGASDEELADLFDAFRQGEKARTNRVSGRVSGTGLGLRLSASVVARHGGNISAANIPAKGLRVCVQLPLASGK
ncbi:MAG: ATP-binding protein, partial [Porticoccaceae bacterium]|nr:ATP-binding protein [Porticoccaceae bacterium]